eukprot:TRINITY_DN276_c0_g6_i1.p1 TRINITY_DN276_c0_g6~~TRINITY_DN276_c0_g6_i1.p1  ORF type:complete len:229 (+),score=84.14 TRINITY_DN276_c0_g6_i1:146-832(+)
MKWIKATNGEVPSDALMAGFEELGSGLYVGRVNCNSKVKIGRVNKRIGGCSFSIDESENIQSNYEVLTFSNKELCWLNWQIHSIDQSIPNNAFEVDSNKIYIGRIKFDGGVHIGTIDSNGLSIGYLGFEKKFKTYEILTWIDFDTSKESDDSDDQSRSRSASPVLTRTRTRSRSRSRSPVLTRTRTRSRSPVARVRRGSITLSTIPNQNQNQNQSDSDSDVGSLGLFD